MTVWETLARYWQDIAAWTGVIGVTVIFYSAEFSAGTVDFSGARFDRGQVGFAGAVFSGGQVSFTTAVFSGGPVNFGGAVHCFAIPTAHGQDSPNCAFNEKASKRGMQMMHNFFDEAFAAK